MNDRVLYRKLIGVRLKSVAIIITRMIPGGASKIVSDIIVGGNGLYNFTLFTGQADFDKETVEKLAVYCKIIIIPDLIREISLIKDFSAYKHLSKELKAGEFDVVHTHTSKAGFVGRMAAAKAKIPVIIHSPHGTIYSCDSIEGVPKLDLGKKLLQIAERKAGEKMTYLTTLSEHEKQICLNLRLSTAENTVVIPNGIDLEKFLILASDRRKARDELNIAKGEFVILSIGRLSPEKGHNVLLDAFSDIVEKYPNTKLFFVGDGGEKAKLQTQAESFKDNVVFTGHKNNVKPYLAIADIFVNPSFYEGFGIAILEAMAAGLPVIASASGGVPEIISDENDGLLFKAGDVKQLKRKISRLIDDEKIRHRIGKNAKMRSQCFSTEKMLKKYFALYG